MEVVFLDHQGMLITDPSLFTFTPNKYKEEIEALKIVLPEVQWQEDLLSNQLIANSFLNALSVQKFHTTRQYREKLLQNHQGPLFRTVVQRVVNRITDPEFHALFLDFLQSSFLSVNTTDQQFVTQLLYKSKSQFNEKSPVRKLALKILRTHDISWQIGDRAYMFSKADVSEKVKQLVPDILTVFQQVQQQKAKKDLLKTSLLGEEKSLEDFYVSSHLR